MADTTLAPEGSCGTMKEAVKLPLRSVAGAGSGKTETTPKDSTELVVKPGKLVPVTVTWLPATPLLGLTVMDALGTEWLLVALAEKPNTVAVTVLVDGMIAPLGT
jgi:hypothetical protein